MNKFEVVIQTAQGFLSYTLIRDVDSPKELWHYLRSQGGVAATAQGGWQVWYPHLQINTIRLIGACIPGLHQQDIQATPNDFPRPSGCLVVKDSGAENTDTERLNRIIRWAINTHNGRYLLEWLDALKLRQLDTNVYKGFRDKLDSFDLSV